MRIAASFLETCALLALVLTLRSAEVIRASDEPRNDERLELLPFSNLHLSLSTPAAKLATAEPIAVYAELRNPRDRAVSGHRRFAWRPRAGTRAGYGGQYLELQMSANWRSQTYPRFRLLAFYAPERRPWIEPGVNLRAKEIIVGEEDPAIIRKLAERTVGAGRHEDAGFLGSSRSLEIWAQFRHCESVDVIRSNTLRVTLEEPKARDAEAYHWLKDRQLTARLGYLASDVRYSDEDVRSFDTFLEKFAGTLYEPYARFGLAQMHFYRSDYAKAAETFRVLVDKHPKASVADDALFLIAESHRRLGEPVAADRWFREVIKRYPETPAADDAQEVLAELAKLPQMLFSDDRRLDVKITFGFSEHTPLGDVFKVVSDLGGVRLRLAPALKGRTLASIVGTQTVREFMAQMDEHKARWVRDEDRSYRLVPADAPE